MWRQFINCTKQSCSPILSFLLKKQSCLEGIFSFAFNGSVVTEAWSIKEKSIKEKRSANTAKEELFWYCSCLNWTVGCPDHHSWHAAIQNHSVLLPLTSTINYSFYMHASMEGEPWILHNMCRKFLWKNVCVPDQGTHLYIVNSSDSSPWQTRHQISPPYIGCASFMHHHAPVLKYLLPPQCMCKLSHHFLLCDHLYNCKLQSKLWPDYM